MAKKNTLSILETIKNKITKFDEKTDKAIRASELDDEFEYVTSETKTDQNKIDDANDLALDGIAEQGSISNNDLDKTAEKENITPKFEDDLGLGDLDETSSEDSLGQNIPAKVDSSALSDDELFNAEGEEVEKSFENIPTGNSKEDDDDFSENDSLAEPQVQNQELETQTQDSNPADLNDDPLNMLKGSGNELFQNTQNSTAGSSQNNMTNPLSNPLDRGDFDQVLGSDKIEDNVAESHDVSVPPTENKNLVEEKPTITQNNSESALEDFSFDDQETKKDSKDNTVQNTDDISVESEVVSKNIEEQKAVENSIPSSNSSPLSESELEPFNMDDFSDVASAKLEEDKNDVSDDLNSNPDSVVEENPLDQKIPSDLDNNQNDQLQNPELKETSEKELKEQPNFDDSLNNELPAQDPFGNPVEDELEELSQTNSNDLSLDQPEKTNEENLDNSQPNADTIFSKAEVESYEGEINFDENAKAKTITDVEEEDDFDIDMLGSQESYEDDDLTLDDDLSLDSLDDELEIKETSDDALSDEDLLLDDDLELDSLNNEEEITEKPKEDLKDLSKEPLDDDLELDSLDQELEQFEEKPKGKEAVEETQKENTKSDDILDDELDLDELDKELEAKAKELKEETKSKEVKSEEIEDDLNQDIDDILDEPKLDETSVDKKTEKPIKVDLEKDDDFNFDDLDEAVDEIVEESEEIIEESDDILEDSKPVIEPKKKSAKNIVDDIDDLDLEELEKEAKKAEEKLDKMEEITKKAIGGELSKDLAEDKKEDKVEEKPSDKNLSDVDEIDLEFEREMMGFKPGEHKKKGDEKKEEPQAKENIKEDSIEKEFESVKEDKVEDEKSEKPLTESVSKEIKDFVAESNNDEDDLFDDESFDDNKPDLAKELSIKDSDINRDSRDSQIQVIQNKSSMLADETVSQAQDSIKRLVDAKKVVSGISTFSKSPALAELAVEIMEPKLERWINEHLPEVVENIVREEIKKIIPKD